MKPTVVEILIGGMTCINCQNKIKSALSRLPGVRNAAVSYKNGKAVVTFDPEKISRKDIEREIKKLDYKVLADPERSEPIRVAAMLVIIVCLYVLLQQVGLLNLLVPSQLADSGMGYGMLFVVGLLTSVHCIAMCGGINLSQCLPKDTGEKKAAFLPSLLYNSGRVIAYTVIGGILGLVGMLLGGGNGAGIPVLLQGILKLIAGVIMVIMGINLLGIFPWMRRLSVHMPGFLSQKINSQKAIERRPFVVGLLNGLMPCGPLQSMQILALASGNPLTGALSMLLFSLGTVPLMLGLGTLVSALGRKFARTVQSVGAVLVAVLGLAMLSQGGSLSGLLLPDRLLFIVIALAVIGIAASIPAPKKAYRIGWIAAACAIMLIAGVIWQNVRSGAAASAPSAQIVDGVQVVESTLSLGEYPTITVRAGVPVRWTIHAPEGSINGCNYKAIIGRYGIEHTFQAGDNIIEFTPTEAETVTYTCWMGMIRGNIIVTE